MAYFINIEVERVRLRLSRAEMAGELGMSTNSLCSKINSRKQFTSRELLELSRITGKSIEYLLEPDSLKLQNRDNTN